MDTTIQFTQYCFICNNSGNESYHLIDTELKSSKILLRDFLANLFQESINNQIICNSCNVLVNRLDYFQQKCQEISQKLLRCFHNNKSTKCTSFHNSAETRDNNLIEEVDNIKNLQNKSKSIVYSEEGAISTANLETIISKNRSVFNRLECKTSTNDWQCIITRENSKDSDKFLVESNFMQERDCVKEHVVIDECDFTKNNDFAKDSDNREGDFSHRKSKLSEKNSKFSKDNSKLSEDNSKLCEDKSMLNGGNFKLSEDDSMLSADNSKLSEDNSMLNEDNSKLSEENSMLSGNNSKLSEDNSILSKDNSMLSEDKSKLSEDYSKLREDNSKLSEDHSKPKLNKDCKPNAAQHNYKSVSSKYNFKAKCSKDNSKPNSYIRFNSNINRGNLKIIKIKPSTKLTEEIHNSSANHEGNENLPSDNFEIPIDYIANKSIKNFEHDTSDSDQIVKELNKINKFMCKECKKSFTQKISLIRHLRLHTGETPFQCEECGKRFMHHTSFKQHKLYHTRHKQYNCTKCSSSFFSNSHLIRHMKTHTQEKKHQCETCGRKFAEKYNLQTHRKVHLDVFLNDNRDEKNDN